MNKLFLISMLVVLSCIAGFAPASAGKPPVFRTADYVMAMKKVTDVMVNDATSPVAASRYYAYISLAANEIQVYGDSSAASFAGKLKQFPGIKLDKGSVLKADLSLVTIYTIFRMGERLLPSGYLLQPQADSLLKVAARKKLSQAVIEQSRLITDTIVLQVMAYSATDGFRSLSGFPRYTPKQEPGMWQPTGPVFMAALEPHWWRLRTFFLDSARQFRPAPLADFDTTKVSPFYAMLYSVYHAGKNLTVEQQEIAMFWDCNPFAVQQIGHVEFALKKISPGGHWIGITGIACLKDKKNLAESAFIHAMVSLTLCDAFIACWDEKYRTNRIRPETAINRWVDPRWRPLLQTPPFPEYTSGHSVISAASASILTRFFGDHFSFTDDTETEFGLKPRRFKSFLHAAEEAGISRFYGGIHYTDAIDNGQVQGKAIAEFILHKIPF
jgi:hypothetical protein